MLSYAAIQFIYCVTVSKIPFAYSNCIPVKTRFTPIITLEQAKNVPIVEQFLIKRESCEFLVRPVCIQTSLSPQKKCDHRSHFLSSSFSHSA
ncbi:hypothetical protein ALT1644_10058 [Alteromonas macleodii]